MPLVCRASFCGAKERPQTERLRDAGFGWETTKTVGKLRDEITLWGVSPEVSATNRHLKITVLRKSRRLLLSHKGSPEIDLLWSLHNPQMP